MSGGGPKYEPYERQPPAADLLLLEDRKERIEAVVAQRTRTLTVVLDQLEDTFNMAAILRTCEGMGVQDVHVIENPEVKFVPNGKVTQGCDKWLDIHLHKNFSDCQAILKADGFAIWASTIADRAVSLYSLKFDTKMALVFGNERYGVSQEVSDGADGGFWIPMRGFTQSLNVSAAASASITRAIAWREENWGRVGDLNEAEIRVLTEHFQRLSVKQRKRLYGS